MVYQGSYDLRRDVDKLKNKTDELAMDYFIQVNSPVISYQNDDYSPSTLTATTYKSSREITDFYDGKIELQQSTDGGATYTQVKVVNGHSLSHRLNNNQLTNLRVNLFDTDLNLLDTQTITIVRTTKGTAGKGYDFAYYTTEKTIVCNSTTPSSNCVPTPDGDIVKVTGNYNEWLQRPKEIDTSHPNVFMSYRTSTDVGWGSWSTPVKYNAIGERGEDGEGLEMIFCRTEALDGYTLDPSTLNPVQTPDYVPNPTGKTEWYDNQRGVTAQYCFEYVCMRKREVKNNGKVGEWGRFTSPRLWATYSEDGKDGKGIELIFARNNSPTSAPTFEGSGSQRQDKKTYTGVDRNGRHFYDDDYLPNNWTDDQTGVDVNNKCEWVAKRLKKVTNGVASWESYNDPQLWATYSEDGDDAISVILGNEAQLIPIDSNGNLKTNPTTITTSVYCYEGTKRVGGTIDISGVSNAFSSKSKIDPTVSSAGTVTLNCTTVPNQITRDEPITVTVNGKTFTKYLTWSKIGDGKDGNSGGTFDFVYYTKNNDTPPSISSSTTIDPNTGRNVVNGWCARPTDTTASYPYCFGAYRQLDHTGTPTGSYSDVYLWAKFGDDGFGIYRISTDIPLTSWSNPDYPNGRYRVAKPDVDAELGSSMIVGDHLIRGDYMYDVLAFNSNNYGLSAGTLLKGANGEDGADGKGLEMIFARNNSTTTAPTFVDGQNQKSYAGVVDGKHFYDDDFVPQNWTDDQQGVNISNMVEWVCMRTKTLGTDGKTGEWQSFNTPKVWATYSEDGSDGYSIYRVSTDIPLTNWLNPSVVGGKYRISRTDVDAEIDGAMVVGDHLIRGDFIYDVLAMSSANYGLNEGQPISGDGHQILYCVTQRENVPSTPTSQTTIHHEGDDINDGVWFDVPIAPTDVYSYCWQSQKTFINGVWGNYQIPVRYNYYTRDGMNGDKGDKGEKGRDGTELTGDEIMMKIAGQNIDAQTVGGLNPADLLTTDIQDSGVIYDSNNHGYYRVLRNGRIVIFALLDYQWTAQTTATLQTIFTLPTWAYPLMNQYGMSVPHGETLSITSGGDVRCTPGTTGLHQLSGSFAYIADLNTKIQTNITVNTTTVTTGDSIQITLTGNNVNLKNTPIKIQVGGQTYTRTTDQNGIVNWNINLNAGTYAVAIKWEGNSTYAPYTKNITLTVNRASSVIIYSENNHSAKITKTIRDGEPVRDLLCEVNINGYIFYQSTDYYGILDFTSVLKNYKGNVIATITTMNTNKCPTTVGGVTLTGTRQTQDYKRYYTPTGVSGDLNGNYNEKSGTWWNYATTGSFAERNDGAYAITDILSSGSTAGNLDVQFTPNLETGAIVKKVTVYVRFASLQGWTSASKGSYDAGQSKITVQNGSGGSLTGISEQNFVVNTISRTDCGKWYELAYSWENLNISKSSLGNPKVHISGIKNGGGGYGNNSRFGIDFVQLILEYEA